MVNSQYPIVSIITVNYNNRDNLEKTLKSISEQTYPCIESIIIDAGSTDGSVQLIKDFSEDFLDENRSCKWVSEPDGGLYYAINKAIPMATGDIIGCLWDKFADTSSLYKLIDCMMESNADAVHGDLTYDDENGKPVRIWKMGQGRIRDGWMPGHPTLYLKKSVYDKYGAYDTSLVSAADYEFMVRALKNESIKIAYVPEIVVNMFYGGLSTSSPKAYMRSIREAYLALKKNSVRFAAWIVAKRIFRTIRQFRSS